VLRGAVNPTLEGQVEVVGDKSPSHQEPPESEFTGLLVLRSASRTGYPEINDGAFQLPYCRPHIRKLPGAERQVGENGASPADHSLGSLVNK
jgi:hypothetical protein